MRTLGYAVLSLLSREEFSGYDLKLRMERPLGYFWSANRSQIYPELARLEEEGFVTHRVVEQRGKPDKKVFGITASGRKARAGASTTLTSSTSRNKVLAPSFLSLMLSPI